MSRDYTYLFFKVVFLLLLASCGINGTGSTTPPTPKPFNYSVTPQTYKVQFRGTPYDIPVDNCENSRDSVKTEERSQKYQFELNINISESIVAELGGDIALAKATIGAQIGSSLGIKIGSENEARSAIQIVTPAGFKTITQAQWKATWTEGSVAILRPEGSTLGVLPFAVLNSLTLDQLGSKTIDCKTGAIVTPTTIVSIIPTAIPDQPATAAAAIPLPQPTTLATPAIVQPTIPRIPPSPIPVTCVHPIDLAQQKGWPVIGWTEDVWGGLYVELTANDELPAKWEGLGPGKKIYQTDTDRQMQPGRWAIYTPYGCRSQFGFSS